MRKERIKKISVNETIRTFHESLCAIVPLFERLELPWREPDAYDNWDRVAEALYKTMVEEEIEYAHIGKPIFGIPKYGFCLPSYAEHSYIGNLTKGQKWAFVGFSTTDKPFDMCNFVVLNVQGKVSDRTVVPLNGITFTFIPRLKTGQLIDPMICMERPEEEYGT